MRKHEKIDYLEFPAVNMQATKLFYQKVFGWEFEDFGPDYSAFNMAGMEGGFYQSEQSANTENGSVLVVLYSENLKETQEKIERAGGIIVKPVFSFPGGRRFQFLDPSGNELGVWSDL